MVPMASACAEYISTCRKQSVSAGEAMRLLFDDDKPEFMKDAE